MPGNVLSYSQAIHEGYDLRAYPFQHIPVGEIEVVLDFKVWAQKVLGISCFFTAVQDNRKFLVTVYLNRNSGRYMLPDCPLDFACCATKYVYCVRIGKTQSGKTRLLHAVLQC